MNNTKKNNKKNNKKIQQRTKKNNLKQRQQYKILTLDALKIISDNGKKPIGLVFMLEGEKTDDQPIQYKFTGNLIKKTMNNSLTDVIKTDKINNWLLENNLLYSKKPSNNNKLYYYLETILNGKTMEIEIFYKDGKNVLGDSMSQGLYYY